MFKGLKKIKGVKNNSRSRTCAMVLSFLVLVCTFFIGLNSFKITQVKAKYSTTLFVQLDANGGNFNGNPTLTYHTTHSFDGTFQPVTLKFDISDTPTRDGYKFLNYTSQDGDTNYNLGVNSFYFTSVGDCKTIFAKWESVYTIKFNKKGGTGTVSDISNVAYTESKTLPNVSLTKTGYTFEGWDTSSTASTVVYKNGQSVSKLTNTAGGTVTLYAVWKPITYKVKYNKNNSSAEGTMSDDTLTYGDAKKLTTNAFARTGYTFSSWNTKADGKGTTYADKASVTNLSSTQDASVNLYAIWTPINYTIRFIKNDDNAEGSMSDLSMKYDQPKNLTASSFTKDGYTFAGWTTGETQTTVEYADGASVTNLANTEGALAVLYALYREHSYKVVFHKNIPGESGEVKQTFTYTENKSLTENSFTRTGYSFSGWNTKADGTGSTYTDKQNVEKLTEEDNGTVDLYAMWTPINYTIRFNKNDDNAQGVMSDLDMKYDETKSLTTSSFTKQGFTFIGWTTDQAQPTVQYGNGVDVSNLTTTEGAVIDLYALYREHTYKVVFNKSELGELGETTNQTFTYTENKSLTENIFTRTGYTFSGWNTKADGSGSTYADKAAVEKLTSDDNGTVNLYAMWSLNTYTIGYDLDEGRVASLNPTTYTVESSKITLNNPEKIGYIFGGWKDQDGNISTDTSIPTGSTGNRTYTATWILDSNITYTVNYYKMDTDGITYSFAESVLKVGTTGDTIQINDASIKKTYEGFTFEGGKEAPSATPVRPSSFDQTSTVLGDNSRVINMYYSRDKHIVSLDKEAGVAGVTGAGEYFYGALVTLGVTLNPTFQFASWAGTLTSSVKNFSFNMPSSDVSLLAKAKLNDEVNFTVNHYKEKEDKSEYGLVNSETKKEVGEKTITISDLSMTIDGYEFVGGKVDAPNKTKPTTFDTVATISLDGTTNINLYYSVKSSGGGSSGGGGGGGSSAPAKPKINPGKSSSDPAEDKANKDAISKIVIKDGKISSLPNEKDIKREGYTFGGFFYDEEFTKPVKVGDTITSDTKVYIKWIKNKTEEEKKLEDEREAVIHFVSGYPDNTFKPNNSITRAEFATVISSIISEDISGMFSYSKDSNQETLSNYKDVRTNFWYSDSISLLISNNLMTGYEDGSFKPNDNITRAEASKVLSLMFDFENSAENSKYDNEIKNTWYEPYVKELVNAGIINGYQDGRFNASNKMTRAEMITLLRRIIETKFGKVELSEDIKNPFSDVLKTDWFYEDVLKCTKR